MRIQPICSYSDSYKGSKTKIPQTSMITGRNKLNEINVLKLASYFEKFEKDLRTTMETFIYMIKY